MRKSFLEETRTNCAAEINFLVINNWTNMTQKLSSFVNEKVGEHGKGLRITVCECYCRERKW